jgi:hypothetical protein
MSFKWLWKFWWFIAIQRNTIQFIDNEKWFLTYWYHEWFRWFDTIKLFEVDWYWRKEWVKIKIHEYEIKKLSHWLGKILIKIRINFHRKNRRTTKAADTLQGEM